MPLAEGTKLDGYEILGPLGAGGMGEVYRARDSALKREVAIKVLPTYVSRDPDRLRRFEQEAQAAATLNHPNILAVYRFGTFDGSPYLVAELLEGSTLREALRHGALSSRKSIDYGAQIAHGLAAAHDKGIVHRDLKPENLFVTKDGRVKILDFGLARLTSRVTNADGYAPTQTAAATNPGVVMGTAGFMSPEQVRGEKVDHRTDIFAFGAILYETLSGKPAFQRSTAAETMTAILQDEPPGISQMQAIPPGLQRVVHRCLEKNPEQRFQSASDLAFALEALSDSGNVPAVAAGGRRTHSRWIWAVCGGAAAVLIAALVAGWRTEPAVPVVESTTQLSDDGKPKGFMATDGLRIYYQDVEAFGIKQVATVGGVTAPVEMRFPRALLEGIAPDRSALLAGTPLDVVRAYGPMWFVPLPAGEPRRLGNLYANDADIFPDGRVVFPKFSQVPDGTAFGGQVDWFVTEKDGSNPSKLTSLPGGLGSASVSPDGEKVIVVQEQPGDRRLFEISASGTGLREIRKLTAGEREFRWTPDGKYLVYRAGTGPQSDIWLLPMEIGLFKRRGEPIRMTNGPVSYSFPCPSRDGKQIFAVGTKRRGELVRYDMKSKRFVPFLGGISATDTTFSRDGEWVAYSSYPDHTIWRSRLDGSERTQLTFAPMDAAFPFISPDGTKVSFYDAKNDLYVVDANGGTPKKIADNTRWASWSPDGNYLVDTGPGFVHQITDMGTGKSSALPGADGMGGIFWLTQDILVGPDKKFSNLVTFNLKTRQLTRLTPDMPGSIEHWMMSLDGKYMYFTTGGAEPMAMRVRIADHQIETITSLKDLHRVLNFGNTQINVAPDGSPVFTRDTGYQDIYALNVRWPR